jgi:phosphoglycolate phosphatase-like HAD superfamily hydrolase
LKSIIAIDCYGVLLDYHEAYCRAWEKAFGVLPELKDPQAYWAIDRWAVYHLPQKELEHFHNQFDYEFWTTLKPIEGSVEACQKFSCAGYDLVCVTGLNMEHVSARLENLQKCDFPITRVVATGKSFANGNPKAATLASLNPEAYVDDYLPYLLDLPDTIHTAIVLRESNGSPNVGKNMNLVNSQHINFAAFAEWWLNR